MLARPSSRSGPHAAAEKHAAAAIAQISARRRLFMTLPPRARAATRLRRARAPVLSSPGSAAADDMTATPSAATIATDRNPQKHTSGHTWRAREVHPRVQTHFEESRITLGFLEESCRWSAGFVRGLGNCSQRGSATFTNIAQEPLGRAPTDQTHRTHLARARSLHRQLAVQDSLEAPYGDTPFRRIRVCHACSRIRGVPVRAQRRGGQATQSRIARDHPAATAPHDGHDEDA